MREIDSNIAVLEKQDFFKPTVNDVSPTISGQGKSDSDDNRKKKLNVGETYNPDKYSLKYGKLSYFNCAICNESMTNTNIKL